MVYLPQLVGMGALPLVGMVSTDQEQKKYGFVGGLDTCGDAARGLRVGQHTNQHPNAHPCLLLADVYAGNDLDRAATQTQQESVSGCFCPAKGLFEKTDGAVYNDW